MGTLNLSLVVDEGECWQVLRRQPLVGCMGRQMELKAGSTCRQEASPEGQRLSGLQMALGRQGLEDEQLRGMGREGPAPMRSEPWLLHGMVATGGTNNVIRSRQRCCSAEGMAAAQCNLKFLPQT